LQASSRNTATKEEISKKAAYDVGKWQTEKTVKELGITEKGTMVLAKYGYPTEGSKVGDNAVFRLEHAKLDDKNFDLKVNFCPYVKTWKALGILDRVPDLCDLLTEGDNGVSIGFRTQTAHDSDQVHVERRPILHLFMERKANTRTA